MATKASKVQAADPNLPAIRIADEIAGWTEKIVSQGGECLEGDFEALQAWKALESDKAQAIAFVDTKMEKDEEFWAQVEKMAKAKKEARAKTRANLRKYLARCLVISGTKKVSQPDGLFTISLIAGKSRVVYDNVGQLPSNMVEVVEEIKPKTAAIKESLERLEALGKQAQAFLDRGEEVPDELEQAMLQAAVPGAHLEYSEDFIQIR